MARASGPAGRRVAVLLSVTLALARGGPRGAGPAAVDERPATQAGTVSLGLDAATRHPDSAGIPRGDLTPGSLWSLIAAVSVPEPAPDREPEAEDHGAEVDPPCRGSVRYGQDVRAGGPRGAASLHGWIDTTASASTSTDAGWTLDVAGRFPWEDLHPPAHRPEAEVPISGLEHFTMSRRWEGIGHLRAGRYAPREVPALGRIDGCEGVIETGRSLRTGLVLGLRPEPAGLEIAGDRPAAGAWAAWSGGSETVRCTASAAVLGTVYEGRVDRVACVASQRADLGGRLILSADTEFDVHGIECAGSDRGAGLTALRVEIGAPLSSRIGLRLGTDHRKLPDTREQRAALGAGEDDPRFTEGSWTHWLGASWRPHPSLELDAQVWLAEEAAAREQEIRWRWAVTRRGIPGMPRAAVHAILEHAGGDDPWETRGRLGAELGVLRDRLRVAPSAAAEFRRDRNGSRHARMTDVSVGLIWRLGPSTDVSATAAYAFTDPCDLVARIGLACLF